MDVIADVAKQPTMACAVVHACTLGRLGSVRTPTGSRIDEREEAAPSIVAPLDEMPIVGEREGMGAGTSIRRAPEHSHNSAHRPTLTARCRA